MVLVVPEGSLPSLGGEIAVGFALGGIALGKPGFAVFFWAAWGRRIGWKRKAGWEEEEEEWVVSCQFYMAGRAAFGSRRRRLRTWVDVLLSGGIVLVVVEHWCARNGGCTIAFGVEQVRVQRHAASFGSRRRRRWWRRHGDKVCYGWRRREEVSRGYMRRAKDLVERSSRLLWSFFFARDRCVIVAC